MATCHQALRQLVDMVFNASHVGIEEVACHQNPVLSLAWRTWQSMMHPIQSEQ